MGRGVVLAAGIAAALSIAASGALAAPGGGGGGGGGSVPSGSTPRYDPAAEYQKGVEALKAEDYKAAITAFKRVQQAAPRNAAANYLLGLSYMQSGDLKKARKPLEQAVKYDEAMIAAWRDLAIVQHKLGEAEAASASLDALLAKQTGCGEGCAQKAEIDAAVAAVQAATQGQDMALDERLRGFGAAEGDAAYLGAVGLINEERYDEALAALDGASRAFGPHPDVLTYIGFAHRKLGRYAEAEDHYRRALAVAPDHLGAIEYYGELKVERGDLAGAREHWARLEALCGFGCYEAEELGRWIAEAERS